jgi:16S rRNA (adenine1518-N6/adenine1519-N6)-dimethyltransferase
VNDSLAARLVTLAGVGSDETVIEIGTGLGVMTRALAARARRVVTLEIDAGLPENVELRHVDALDVDLSALAQALGAKVRLVGNLPYAISSPLLRRLLDVRDRILGWSVMLQRELAQRLVAEPGTRDYGSLSVLHRLTVEVQRMMDLRPGCFLPAPRVVSSFLRITPRADAKVSSAELARVERVARAAFSARRKTLANALRGGLGAAVAPAQIAAALASAGLEPGIRAERLEPGRFVALADAFGSALAGWRRASSWTAWSTSPASWGSRSAASRPARFRRPSRWHRAASAGCGAGCSCCWPRLIPWKTGSTP